ncbi:MAG: RluA family pseudouridine synthase [Ruminococcus sp.]|nr:RluA family pseudouridine synthase [Ruminococcus sp.]
MSEPIFLTVPIEEGGERLDKWLAAQDLPLTRSAIQGLIESGMVTRNGNPSNKKEKLRAGDTISVEIPDPEPLDVTPQNLPIDIIYEDDSLLVVNKPKGMVVHPAPGHPDGTLVNALLYHCAGRLSSINGVIRPGIVHRIDMNTSGLLIVAKTDAAHTHLAAQIQAHSFHRAYAAIACGRFGTTEGTIHEPIGRSPRDRQKMCVIATGRDAITHYTVEEQYARHALVRCVLETGRTHQIRVHLTRIGHPIYGDDVYGTAVKGVQGQCLHAKEIGFVHPQTEQWLSFDSPLPAEFLEIQRKVASLRD